MKNERNFYIDGKWVTPHSKQTLDVLNPANEAVIGTITLGDQEDVNRAVAAAKKAFQTFSKTTVEERAALLEKIMAAYQKRMPDIATTVSSEMGAPLSLANAAQAPAGLGHIAYTLNAMKTFKWEEDRGRNRIVHEPIGVCALITPWNWPLNQIACKVAPALAAGCTMVLKPTRDRAAERDPARRGAATRPACRAGVFNLVNGDGPDGRRGDRRHIPTSTWCRSPARPAPASRCAKAAADTVKRVQQELGGKSANIILDDADFPKPVAQRRAFACCTNSGQSCNAPTRMLVPRSAARRGRGDRQGRRDGGEGRRPARRRTRPSARWSSKAQFDKIQRLIQTGIDEGAKLVPAAPGRPDGLNSGYFVQPTVFAERHATT